jgi:Ca-activated chloride channel family protein
MNPLILCALCCGLGAAGPHDADPHDAYQQKAYEQALQGFLQMQLDHPHDLRLLMNVGSAHYQLGQFEMAEKAFRQAAGSRDPTAREHALYGLGNSAYRQGKLDEAQAHYQAALTLDPNDLDARANLAYVRQEKQQRQEQAKQQKKEKQEKPARDKQNSAGEDKPAKPKQGKQEPPADSDKGTKPAAPAPAHKPAERPPQTPEQKAKQQAERTLDGMGEDRPARRPTTPTRPSNGKDW